MTIHTTEDQNDLLYDLLSGSALDTALTGGVYKGFRPANSALEEAVIGSMVIGEGTVQSGVSNVNIYVPKLNAKINGIDQKVRNSARIKVLVGIAQGLLKVNYGATYAFYMANQSEYDEPEINQTRLSFRIEFRFHNV